MADTTYSSGEGAYFAQGALINTTEVGSSPTPLLALETYDETSSNVLTNGDFETGDYTGWTTTGSPTIDSGSAHGGTYNANLPNTATISQTVGSFSGKHPILVFWHKGPAVSLTHEMLDVGNASVMSRSAVFPDTGGVWVRCSSSLYNDSATATQAKITLTSGGTNCLIDDVSLLSLTDYAGLFVGDGFSTNKDIVRIRARKLLIGTGSASAHSEALDIRGTAYIDGATGIASTLSVGDNLTAYKKLVVTGAELSPIDVTSTLAGGFGLTFRSTPSGNSQANDNHDLSFNSQNSAGVAYQAALLRVLNVSPTSGNEDSTVDVYVKVAGSALSKRLSVGANLTLAEGLNLAVGTTTGTKIGTATTQKLGFFNATPVVRPSAYTQTYTTSTKTQSNLTAAAPPAGGTGTAAGAYDTAAHRNAMITSLTNLITDVANVKQVLNAVIDDLQALGLLS